MTASTKNDFRTDEDGACEHEVMFLVTEIELPKPHAPRFVDRTAPPFAHDGYPVDELFLSASDRRGVASIPPTFIGYTAHFGPDEILFRSGDAFKNLYSIKSGAFKNSHLDTDGKVQITGFSMAGELLGMDAIGSQQYINDVTSLCSSDVWVLSFARLQELFGTVPSLVQRFNRMMSSEIARQHEMQLLLSTMRAEQRFAVFLINLSVKYGTAESPAKTFSLKMTREDIGSYLCLTVETISRLSTRFCKNGWLRIACRNVEIPEFAALLEIASGRQRATPI